MRKKNLQDTYTKHSSVLRYPDNSDISRSSSLFTLGLMRRSESHSLNNQAKIDSTHITERSGQEQNHQLGCPDFTERHDDAEVANMMT
jgi:hypothetical protein